MIERMNISISNGHTYHNASVVSLKLTDDEMKFLPYIIMMYLNNNFKKQNPTKMWLVYNCIPI